MPKGKVKVKFIGGVLDGEHDDNFRSILLSNSLVVASGYWFKKDNSVYSIMKGKICRDSWISYGTHKYEKHEKNIDGYYEYIFTGSDAVHRCTAKTKKGSQCKKPALKEIDTCATHKIKSD